MGGLGIRYSAHAPHITSRASQTPCTVLGNVYVIESLQSPPTSRRGRGFRMTFKGITETAMQCKQKVMSEMVIGSSVTVMLSIITGLTHEEFTQYRAYRLEVSCRCIRPTHVHCMSYFSSSPAVVIATGWQLGVKDAHHIPIW